MILFITGLCLTMACAGWALNEAKQEKWGGVFRVWAIVLFTTAAVDLLLYALLAKSLRF